MVYFEKGVLARVMNKMTYALKDGNLVSINDVESGLACNCVCPACNKKLVAKKGKIKIPHFAHASAESCEHAYESSLHYMAKEIFQNAGSFTVPRVMFGNYGAICLEESRNIKIKNVFIEQTIKDIKPDIIIEDEEGNKYYVEIFVTHKIDADKLVKIHREKVNTLEYDLSSISRLLTYEELAELLLNGSISPQWIYHQRIEEAKTIYAVSISRLAYAYCQRGYTPNPVHCITHCIHGMGISDDYKTVYCKNASKVNPQPGGYCPWCGGKLKLRTGWSYVYKRNNKFWGCSNYPNCKYTKEY